MSKRHTPESFWAIVNPTSKDECCIWPRATNNSGYGIVIYQGKSQLAHRVAYEITFGPLPSYKDEDVELDHYICNTHDCVNPYHLQPKSHLENMQTVVLPNSLKTHCRNGHPYSGDNVFVSSGRRRCRICHVNNGLNHQMRSLGDD